jgi:adenosylcobinamide-phosphate synthase
LLPSAPLLVGAVLSDLLFGDPVYAGHPVRMMGWTLEQFEKVLRRLKLDGYFGGILLFLLLATLWCGGTAGLVVILARWNDSVMLAVQLYLIYSLLAMRDLLQHGCAVERAIHRGDLPEARRQTSQLVSRDTDHMDFAACRRATIESLSENLTDGFVSPIFWYAVGGLPGIVLFKVVSTMDSMVGYKSAPYVRFGWCGARLDDVMNWLPARISWLMIAFCSAILPGCSAIKALRFGWRQHALIPGPNSGWSEAATAGGMQRRIVGEIWRHGVLVTNLWLGDPVDPAAGDDSDVRSASFLLTATGLVAAFLAVLAIAAMRDV